MIRVLIEDTRIIPFEVAISDFKITNSITAPSPLKYSNSHSYEASIQSMLGHHRYIVRQRNAGGPMIARF